MSTRTGSNSALLVIDLQVGVIADAWHRDRIVENAAAAVRRAREAGAPVIWVQHHYEELKRGSTEWEWAQGLEPAAGEARIFKSYNSAFTDLLDLLDRQGVSR